MPQAVQQPATGYPAEIREEADRVARAQRNAARTAAPAMAITRADIPFWDVFCFALKFFIAQAIIGIPVAVALWFLLTR